METLSENRRARFDYEISDTLEAGIELRGFEVKSAKLGRINLAGARAILRGGEAWLLGADIPPYQPRNTPSDYDPRRTRKLLIHRNELARLAGPLGGKRRMLIPLRARLSRNFIKIELGIGTPRKKYDKRGLIKKRAAAEAMREATRGAPSNE